MKLFIKAWKSKEMLRAKMLRKKGRIEKLLKRNLMRSRKNMMNLRGTTQSSRPSSETFKGTLTKSKAQLYSLRPRMILISKMLRKKSETSTKISKSSTK